MDEQKVEEFAVIATAVFLTLTCAAMVVALTEAMFGLAGVAVLLVIFATSLIAAGVAVWKGV
jgi:ABC-type siderophore export system fused ATPase/permease subunit